MRKYLLLSFVFLSFGAFANSAGLGQLGEDSGSDSKNNCYRKEIQGCGPCFKLCMEQNSGDRGAKDVAGGSKAPAKKGSSSATAQ